MGDRAKALRDRLIGTEQRVTTSGLGRLFKTGRSAAGLATAMLGGRFRGLGEGLEAADAAAIAQLVTRLGELRGVAMKAGQILGYVDPGLAPELRELLSLLQTAAPASPFGEVERTIREAFGARAPELLAALSREPVAVASIGQVHRARLADGRELAVKIRHAGIDEALRNDFKAAGAGAAIAGVFAGAGGGDSVRSFVDEGRTAFLEECDYALEAERQRTFGRLFADDPEIVVPAVADEWCAPAVLASEWRPGRGLETWLANAPSQDERDRVGAALFRFYFGTLYRHGLFHADPHPGNSGVLEDGRVVVYDFGCVRTFDRATVEGFAAAARAARADDVPALRRALVQLGARPDEGPETDETIRRLLRSFFAPILEPGPRALAPDTGVEARQLVRDKRALLRLRLPGRLLFLFRLRFGLYAVLSRLGARADWAALEGGWAEEALGFRPAA